MKYNSEKHHRRSIRLKGYDYSQSGLYFITICVQNRHCLFGEIENGEMICNEYGKIAATEWINTESIRDNIRLHEYIIMPNHIHGIIEIVRRTDDGKGESQFAPLGKDDGKGDGKGEDEGKGELQFAPTAPTIIKSLKYKIWQRNYYEHIIRNEKSYQRISEYIITNPQIWYIDKFKI